MHNMHSLKLASKLRVKVRETYISTLASIYAAINHSLRNLSFPWEDSAAQPQNSDGLELKGTDCSEHTNTSSKAHGTGRIIFYHLQS